jgi:hypothetical protein
VDNPTLRFHNFPRKLKDEWISACKNPGLQSVKDITLWTHYFVCGKHFSRCDYSLILTPFKQKLKAGAIPMSEEELLSSGMLN